MEVIRLSFESTSYVVGEPQRCVILATTPKKMFQFAGWINVPSGTTFLSHLNSSSPTLSLNSEGNMSNKSNSVVSNVFKNTNIVNNNCLNLFDDSNEQSGFFSSASSIGLFTGVFISDDKLLTGTLKRIILIMKLLLMFVVIVLFILLN